MDNKTSERIEEIFENLFYIFLSKTLNLYTIFFKLEFVLLKQYFCSQNRNRIDKFFEKQQNLVAKIVSLRWRSALWLDTLRLYRVYIFLKQLKQRSCPQGSTACNQFRFVLEKSEIVIEDI